jgi:hypothetical protein
MPLILSKFWHDLRPVLELQGDDGSVHVSVPVKLYNEVAVGLTIALPPLGSEDAHVLGVLEVEI